MSLAVSSSCFCVRNSCSVPSAALVVADAGFGAQLHAGNRGCTRPAAPCAHLLTRVARFGAVAQHRRLQRQHRGVEQRLDDQRAVLHQQPLDRLHRHARPGPGRGIAGRDLAGVGVAGFERRRGLAVDHRHLVAGLGQVVGAGRADHAAAEDENFDGCSFGRAHRPSALRPGGAGSCVAKQRPCPPSTPLARAKCSGYPCGFQRGWFSSGSNGTEHINQALRRAPRVGISSRRAARPSLLLRDQRQDVVARDQLAVLVGDLARPTRRRPAPTPLASLRLRSILRLQVSRAWIVSPMPTGLTKRSVSSP